MQQKRLPGEVRDVAGRFYPRKDARNSEFCVDFDTGLGLREKGHGVEGIDGPPELLVRLVDGINDGPERAGIGGVAAAMMPSTEAVA